MEKPNLPDLKITTTPVQFLTEVKSELKKVNWPTRAETVKLTSVVIAISLIVGLFIGGFDMLFLNLATLLLGGK